MIDDLPRDEAEALLELIKFGDPSGGWDSARELAGVANCAFRVTDSDGKRIQGVTVDLLIKYGQRPPSTHYLFTVFKFEYGGLRRVYQLDVLQNGRKMRDAHSMPHEHIGRDRVAGDVAWATIKYDEALGLFCSRTNLTLISDLPDPSVLTLQ
jgi:hypothetical protein